MSIIESSGRELIPIVLPIEEYDCSFMKDDEAIEWLKNRYIRVSRNESILDISANDLKRRKRIEEKFISRGNERLNYYVCRYGVSAEYLVDLSKFKGDYENLLLKGALSNEFFVWNSFTLFSNTFKEMVSSFPASRECLEILTRNEALRRYNLTLIIEQRKNIDAFKGEHFCSFFIDLLMAAPAVRGIYDHTILDGAAEFLHDRLEFECAKWLAELAPSVNVIDSVKKLITIANFSSVDKDYYDDFLNSWTFDEKNEKIVEGPKIERIKNLYGDVRLHFATRIFGSFSEFKAKKAKEFLENYIDDVFIRHAFYRSAPLDAILGFNFYSHKIDDDDFIYFKKYTRDVEGKQREELFSDSMRKRLAHLHNQDSKEISDLEKIEMSFLLHFSRDGNEFIEHFAFNRRLAGSKFLRETLERAAWDLAFDPKHDMWTINLVRMASKDFGDVDGDIAPFEIKNEFKIISKNLTSLQDNLQSINFNLDRNSDLKSEINILSKDLSKSLRNDVNQQGVVLASHIDEKLDLYANQSNHEGKNIRESIFNKIDISAFRMIFWTTFWVSLINQFLFWGWVILK